MKKSYVEIKVTRKDIDKGVYTEPTQCPIARAMRRAGLRNTIASSVLRGQYKGEQYQMKTPKKALRFMERFDEGAYGTRKTLKPFTFRFWLRD